VVVELETATTVLPWAVALAVVVVLKGIQAAHLEQLTRDLQAELTVAVEVALVVLELMVQAQMVVLAYLL
jgi:hypothetical protein